jgi:hypothetical protein
MIKGRFLLVAVCLLVVGLVLTACGGGNNGVGSHGSAAPPADVTAPSDDVSVPDDSNVSVDVTSFPVSVLLDYTSLQEIAVSPDGDIYCMYYTAPEINQGDVDRCMIARYLPDSGELEQIYQCGSFLERRVMIVQWLTATNDSLYWMEQIYDDFPGYANIMRIDFTKDELEEIQRIDGQNVERHDTDIPAKTNFQDTAAALNAAEANDPPGELKCPVWQDRNTLWALNYDTKTHECKSIEKISVLRD